MTAPSSPPPPPPPPSGSPRGLPSRRTRRRRRHPIGTSPGTLQPGPDAVPLSLAVIAYGPAGVVERQNPSRSEIAALRRDAAMVWVDATGVGDAAMLRGLGEEFHLDRLALEDVVNLQQRAKVEDYGDHTFLVLRMIDAAQTAETEQFAIFLGKDFLVTFQERTGDCFQMVRARLRDAAGQMQKRGADYLAYALLDAVVDAYFPVIEGHDQRLEAIEHAILDGKQSIDTMQELHVVRRCLLELRRAVWPLREATSTLVRGEPRFFSPAVHPYLRDVHDHVVQLLDLLENYREMTNSLIELHLSTINHRLNEVMKLLTVISTIFIPLTFLVGVYGMNFDYMPELHERWGYPLVWVVMITVAVSMLIWFRRRGWLGTPGAATGR